MSVSWTKAKLKRDMTGVEMTFVVITVLAV